MHLRPKLIPSTTCQSLFCLLLSFDTTNHVKMITLMHAPFLSLQSIIALDIFSQVANKSGFMDEEGLRRCLQILSVVRLFVFLDSISH